MQRHELEHLIRAAAAITGAEEIVVIGSQAILGAVPNAPASMLRSSEADLFTLRDPKDADLVDGSIGEGPPFHETFGYSSGRTLRCCRLAGRSGWFRFVTRTPVVW
jgi:hypothetical protein